MNVHLAFCKPNGLQEIPNPDNPEEDKRQESGEKMAVRVQAITRTGWNPEGVKSSTDFDRRQPVYLIGV